MYACMPKLMPCGNGMCSFRHTSRHIGLNSTWKAHRFGHGIEATSSHYGECVHRYRLHPISIVSRSQNHFTMGIYLLNVECIELICIFYFCFRFFPFCKIHSIRYGYVHWMHFMVLKIRHFLYSHIWCAAFASLLRLHWILITTQPWALQLVFHLIWMPIFVM